MDWRDNAATIDKFLSENLGYPLVHNDFNSYTHQKLSNTTKRIKNFGFLHIPYPWALSRIVARMLLSQKCLLGHLPCMRNIFRSPRQACLPPNFYLDTVDQCMQSLRSWLLPVCSRKKQGKQIGFASASKKQKTAQDFEFVWVTTHLHLTVLLFVIKNP